MHSYAIKGWEPPFPVMAHATKEVSASWVFRLQAPVHVCKQQPGGLCTCLLRSIELMCWYPPMIVLAAKFIYLFIYCSRLFRTYLLPMGWFECCYVALGFFSMGQFAHPSLRHLLGTCLFVHG